MIEVDIRSLGMGPDLVVLHGQPAPPESVFAITDAFGAQARVLIPDYCAIGEDPQTTATLLGKALADHDVHQATIIGHSFGTYHAFQLATQGAIDVTKIIAIGAISHLPDQVKQEFLGLADAIDAEQIDLAPMLRDRWFGPRYVSEHPEIEATLKGWLDAMGDDRIARAARVDCIGSDLRPHLENLSIPVHLVVGDQDQATPLAWSEEIAHIVPDATLDVLEGIGHFPHIEAEQTTIDLLRGYLGD